MKLKSVLLIDDDHTTNVFHTVVLRRSQISEQILTMETPEIALEHLQKASKNNGASFGQMSMPELIFLDVNMPRMTGFEFLTEFEKLARDEASPCVIYMLTAAASGRDHASFLHFKNVKGILQKPLTKDIIAKIMATDFSSEIV